MKDFCKELMQGQYSDSHTYSCFIVVHTGVDMFLLSNSLYNVQYMQTKTCDVSAVWVYVQRLKHGFKIFGIVYIMEFKIVQWGKWWEWSQFLTGL